MKKKGGAKIMIKESLKLKYEKKEQPKSPQPKSSQPKSSQPVAVETAYGVENGRNPARKK